MFCESRKKKLKYVILEKWAGKTKMTTKKFGAIHLLRKGDFDHF